MHCQECSNPPAILIKGVALCATHANQLLALSAQRGEKAAHMSAASIISAFHPVDKPPQRLSVPPLRHITVRVV